MLILIEEKQKNKIKNRMTGMFIEQRKQTFLRACFSAVPFSYMIIFMLCVHRFNLTP